MNRYERAEILTINRKAVRTRKSKNGKGQGRTPTPIAGVTRLQSGCLSVGDSVSVKLPSEKRIALSEFAMRGRAAAGKTLQDMWSEDPALHPRWRGGRYVNHAGYVMLRVWEGGVGRYRLEHRVVMESVVGRALSPTETVHHRNGDRRDNRPENLELWVSRHGRGQRAAEAMIEDPRFCPIRLE